MKTNKISVDEAKQDKLFYVTANAVIVRDDGRCLILKRSEREKVYPGKWTIVGEKIEHVDLDLNNPSRQEGDVAVFVNPVQKILERGAMEEAGIKIKPQSEFIADRAIVRPDGIPVIVLVYKAFYESGEVKPQEGDFTDFAWANAEELASYDCISGIIGDIKAALHDR